MRLVGHLLLSAQNQDLRDQSKQPTINWKMFHLKVIKVFEYPFHSSVEEFIHWGAICGTHFEWFKLNLSQANSNVVSKGSSAVVSSLSGNLITEPFSMNTLDSASSSSPPETNFTTELSTENGKNLISNRIVCQPSALSRPPTTRVALLPRLRRVDRRRTIATDTCQ